MAPARNARQHSAPTGKTGRPSHVPTDSNRKVVLLGAGMLVPHEDIGQILGISKHTLEKHYPKELAEGKAIFHGRLKMKAGQLALEGNVPMIIFLLKTQCGFRTVDPEGDEEREAIRVIVKGGLPAPAN